MQSTADQAFEKMFTGTKWAATQFVPTSLSGAVSALTAGGIYTSATKGGLAIVGALQLWTNLLPLTIALPGAQTASQLFLSLTVGSLTSAQADIFVYGAILD